MLFRSVGHPPPTSRRAVWHEYIVGVPAVDAFFVEFHTNSEECRVHGSRCAVYRFPVGSFTGCDSFQYKVEVLLVFLLVANLRQDIKIRVVFAVCIVIPSTESAFAYRKLA